MSPVAPPRELVLASAGAGKTFRISSRLVGLLAAGAPPETLLASSFTRKAAGQILDRTLDRIARAALDPNDARELASHAALNPESQLEANPAAWARLLERAVRNLHRLSVGTLDAFMVGAAASFEAELGLPPGWRIADESEIERLVSRTLTAMLTSADRDEVLRLVRLTAPGPTSRSIHGRLAGRMGELLGIQEGLADPGPTPWSVFRNGGACVRPTASERERLAAEIEAIPVPLNKNGGENRNWRKALAEVARCARSADWEKLIATTLCKRVREGELNYSGIDIEPIVCRTFESAVEMAQAAIRADLADEIEALGELTRMYEAGYRAAQKTAGAFRFDDITRLIGAGDPLGNRSDLYYRLDGRIRHILLDEFQDTSTRQWRALEPLLDEVLSDDGRAAVIVADPKQSIYGWRGAEPRLVHAVGARYMLAIDHLAVSWRSSQVVLDLVNQVFEGIAGNPVIRGDPVREQVADLWAADFMKHRAQKSHLPGYVAIEAGPEDEGRGNQRPLLCAHTARRIAELRQAAPGFSIGVLTRTNRTVARLFLELRNLGVPVSQEGGNPLTDSAACEAVLALMRLADHPGDTIAAYHVARSPVGEIVMLTDHRNLAAVRRVARKVRTDLLSEGYGPTIGAMAWRLAGYCDRRDARRLVQLAELAHQYDARATLRPMDFVRAVEAARIEDPTSADVRVMTVHQAKGLEFDIVVLPELGGAAVQGGVGSVLPYRSNEVGAIEAIFPAARQAVRGLFPELEEAANQRLTGNWRDALSSLYVALTRARYAVHLVVAPQSLTSKGKTVTAGAIVWAAVADDSPPPEAEPGTVLHSAGEVNWFSEGAAEPEVDTVLAAPAAAPPEIRVQVAAADRALRRETPSGLHTTVNVRNLLQIDAADAMARGSVVHAWFEQVGWVEDGVPDDDELRRIASEIAPYFSGELLTSCLADFRGWLETPTIREVLSRTRYSGSAQIERELPFLHRSGDVLMEGVIDRLVLRLEGTSFVSAEILDYKTDRVATIDLDDRVADYRPQLQAYARAVSSMYDIPPARCTASLIFLEPGRVVPITGREDQPEPVTPII